MRVALIALSVRGAMGHYLDALITPLTEQAEVHLFVPEHYSEKTGKATVHLFSTGSNKRDAILRLLNPFLGLPLWQRIEKIKPDVVHLFNGEGYPWTLLWVYWANHKKLPMVVTVHDPEPHPGNLQHLINSYLGRFTLVRASRVHIHSKSMYHNVPVLASNRDGMKEVLPEEWLFDCCDSDSFIKSLLRIKNMDNTDFIKKNKLKIISEFDVENFGRSFYEAITNN